MPIARVDVGVACSNFQSSNWWLPIWGILIAEIRNDIDIGELYAINSAMPDHNKNNIISSSPFVLPNPEYKTRNQLTDANRQSITKRFLDGTSDWLFFIDDDTVPPVGVISHLLTLQREFSAGLYFNPKPPYNPIAYMKAEGGHGIYNAYYGYAPGTIEQVDAVGMGCTLLHRSVFEKIIEGHQVFQRPNGSLIPVRKDRISIQPDMPWGGEEQVINDVLYSPLTHLGDEMDNRAWPFFAMEYGRTEDMYFCELADSVGIKPWLDTTVVCQHFKTLAVDEENYRKEWLSKYG